MGVGIRNLVVCCDGTWNTPGQTARGVPAPTNVVRIFNACIEAPDQLRYYHPGVGAEGGRVARLVAGGIGLGLDRNIKSAYAWLCRHYRAGDRIYLFGFSRGAYTVRSLGGLMLRVGLLDFTGLKDPEIWRRVESAYRDGYRNKLPQSHWGKDWPMLAGEGGEPPDIHFMGVWDTVGARGIPDDMILFDLLFDRPRRYRFHDTRLHDRVRNAFHALALDEPRASFAPTLWTLKAPRPAETRFEQRWFPGNHGDVGGGHVETGLSDGALVWMVACARECGLQMDDRLLDQLRPDPQGVLHQSVKGVWREMRTLPRAVPLLQDAGTGSDALHGSVLLRRSDPPITQAPYRDTTTLGAGEQWTGNIYASQHWNATGVWLDEGVKYRFDALGEWVDLFNKSGPEGLTGQWWRPGRLGYAVGNLLGLAERAYQKATGKKGADWFGSRRCERAPWCALVGMIANQRDVDGGGTPPSGETFAIGKGRTYTPRKSGYLYCFANDAWHFYANNRGSVWLRIVWRDGGAGV